MSAHALTEKAMVVNLSIGLWAGYRLDREASRKVTDNAGAKADAARVNKHLVSKESLEAVKAAGNAIRSHFYDNTLPWRDNGDRLMTRVLYLRFIEQHEKLVTEFHAEVEKFLTEKYPSAVEQAGFRMGDLFKREDYPAVSELRRRFYITLDIDALTTSNDFRVQIDEAHADKVRASMEEAAERRVNTAMADVWKRLADTVGLLAERLSDPKAVFRDATVTTNVTELIDLIPGLNLLDDPNIEAVRKLVKDKLGAIDVTGARKDPEYRQEVAEDAKAIMDQMSGFMRAFGGGK